MKCKTDDERAAHGADQRLVRCAEQREKARARSKAYYLEHRSECARKSYLRRLPGIKKPKEATLRLHGLPVDDRRLAPATREAFHHDIFMKVA